MEKVDDAVREAVGTDHWTPDLGDRQEADHSGRSAFAEELLGAVAH